MSDDSDSSSDSDLPIKRKKNVRCLQDSPTTSSNNSSPIGNTSKRRLNRSRVNFSESDSDSGSSIDTKRRKRKLPRITTDESDTTSSGSAIKTTRVRSAKRLPSESEASFEDSDSSQWETDVSDNEKTNPTAAATTSTSTAKSKKSDCDSDSSNGQSEKCPICLISFKAQEVGTPETCDHAFCVECIQEWSKNMNTCPVDRHKFTMILVRKHLNGKVIRQIPIQSPNPCDHLELIEDTTACEICGSSEREDRMLLCDGCDLGFHLECLNPPLADVPTGSWYCNSCSPNHIFEGAIAPYEVQLLFDAVGDLLMHSDRRGNYPFSRLIPRTRQSERVRRRIVNNRNNQITQRNNINNNNTERTVTSTTTIKRKRKKRRKTKRRRYRTVYEIDKLTGETVTIKKLIRRRKCKKRRKTKRNNNNNNNNKGRKQRERLVVKKKSVKERLAKQLGILCPSRSVPQSIPDIRTPNQTTSIGLQRQQTGIPTLDLFGHRNDLEDYISFSDDDNDQIDLNNGLLIRGRSNCFFRRNNRLKSIVDIQFTPQTSTTVTSSTTDFLDTILNNQTKFHSKHTVFSVDKSGKFNMINNNNNNNKVDLNNYQNCLRKCPTTNDDNNDNSPSSSGVQSNSNNSNNNLISTSTIDDNNSTVVSTAGGERGGNNESTGQDYFNQNSSHFTYDSNDDNTRKKTDKNDDDNNKSDSDIDIYSDIESVSTSKIDDVDYNNKQSTTSSSPLPPLSTNITTGDDNTDDDDDNNNSDTDMVIDTEKIDNEKLLEQSLIDDNDNEDENVTSTVNTNATLEIQSKTIQSTNDNSNHNDDDDNNRSKDDDDDSDDDGCPNFSIYSKESINLAKNTDIFLSETNNQIGEISSSPAIYVERNDLLNDTIKNDEKKVSTGLYSDSEDETIVKKDLIGGTTTTTTTTFGLSDIRNMTEDISEEERSYTPCLDERILPITFRQGLDGLDTEMIVSDEDRNDFDETHDLKATSDGGDALEINAKESELDFNNRPDDYEEGEIVDKKKKLDETNKKIENDDKKNITTTTTNKTENVNKELLVTTTTTTTTASFKKLSRNNKERNYRDRGGGGGGDKNRQRRSKSRDRKDDSKKEKRKEIERYDVRALIAEKPRRIKDKFGRDLRRSTSSRSLTPSTPIHQGQRRSLSVNKNNSKSRRSLSRERNTTSTTQRRNNNTKRSVGGGGDSGWTSNRNNKSISRSRSRSINKRSRSKTKKRQLSRERIRRKSIERLKNNTQKTKKRRNNSRHRTRSPPTPKRRKSEWNHHQRSNRYSREWSPLSLSRSKSIDEPIRHLSPSWTPPRPRLDNSTTTTTTTTTTIKPHNLTVILPNDKKKKEKKKKIDKKLKEKSDKLTKKRNKRNNNNNNEHTPPPSKEVFASGDNILVSVSFNKENTEVRDISTISSSTKRNNNNSSSSSNNKNNTNNNKNNEDIAVPIKKLRKEKRNRIRSKRARDLSDIKPVAIIDLERSPFKEITPSPKDVIVLSDSDNNNEIELNLEKNLCDSSEQVASPEQYTTINSVGGPKTPPEPQVKFTLNSKPIQLRQITNPLHEPDDCEHEEEEEEEEEEMQQVNQTIHIIGPNTPPEPEPNSPPSSPDAYDPFEPTKSRSPTPEPINNIQTIQTNNVRDVDDDNNGDLLENRLNITSNDLIIDKTNQTSSDLLLIKSHTPPLLLADIQPADSQSGSMNVTTPESNIGKSPNELVNILKPITQTIIPFSSSSSSSVPPTSMIQSSTSVSSNLTSSNRLNILSTTIITPSIIPQRLVLPNLIKSSPVKVSPTKLSSSLSSSTTLMTKRKLNNRNQNGGNNNNESNNDVNLIFDSPYSPGSSDYEDLFEPPVDAIIKAPLNKLTTGNKTVKSPIKIPSTFDSLFGSTSPAGYNTNNSGSSSSKNIINKNKIEKTNNNKFISSNSNKKSSTNTTTSATNKNNKGNNNNNNTNKQVGIKLDEDNLKILDELPNSAVEMQIKDKFLKKLNRQERVVEEVKLVLKPHYNKKHVNKEEYKDILRRAVPKICHNKSGEINPTKIKNLIEAYVKKIRHSKKVTSSSSSVNLQKS